MHNGQAAYLCAAPDNVWPNTECADSLAKNCDQVRHDSEKCVACTRAHNGPPGKPLCKPKERNAFCNATSGLGNVAAAGNNTAPFSHVSTQCQPCGACEHPHSRLCDLARVSSDSRCLRADYRNDYVVKELNDTTTRVDNSVRIGSWSSYSHAQFGNRSAAFVRQAVTLGKPFFAYIGTTGPHLPCIPAPWHLEEVKSWSNVTAPRPPTFNAHMATHHPTIAALPEIPSDGVKIVDQQMRDRWGTLLSVDDLVAGVVHNLEQLNVLSKTYILFSSDHGCALRACVALERTATLTLSRLLRPPRRIQTADGEDVAVRDRREDPLLHRWARH